MARSVGLPPPSLSPFGSGSAGFGQYDVLDVSAAAGKEFQKAQAAWHAGKISDTAYLAAWAKYIRQLPDGISKINAQDGYDQQVYVFARDKITQRITDGDETAWRDLIAFDRRSLAGMNRSNTEYQLRVGRLRQSQVGAFTVERDKIAKRYSREEVSTRQLWQWYRNQLTDDLVSNNPGLRDAILESVDDLKARLADENRAKTYKAWSEGDMGTTEFISYAAQQVAILGRRTPAGQVWRGYINDARQQAAEADLRFRWGLSEQLHAAQAELASPPPSKKGFRTILRNGQWVHVPDTTAPTSAEQAQYQQYLARQETARKTVERLQQRMASIGGQWVTPEDMVTYYTERLKGLGPGTIEWFNTRQIVDGFQDTALAWSIITPENGFYTIPPAPQDPSLPTGAAGNPLPGEKGITLDRFLQAMAQAESGGNYQARNSTSGAYGKYQIMPSNWPSWASKYLGDPNAKMTPANQDRVARGKVADLYKWLGSWGMVAHWWLTGDGDTRSVSQWSNTARNYVTNILGNLGVNNVPNSWVFYDVAPPKGAPMPGTPPVGSGFGSGWGGRTDVGGGANLTDASAGASAYGVNLKARDMSWADLVVALKQGRGAIAMGLASAYNGTNLARWDPAFAASGDDSKHGVFIIRYQNGKIFWMDPEATTGYKGEWVDADMVRRYLAGYSGSMNMVGVAISNRPIAEIPELVSEREPGPWSGCVWASAAMMVNGIKGRRVATMQQIRSYGESAYYVGDTFRSVWKGGDDGPSTKPGSPGNTPGPKPGPDTYEYPDPSTGQPQDRTTPEGSPTTEVPGGQVLPPGRGDFTGIGTGQPVNPYATATGTEMNRRSQLTAAESQIRQPDFYILEASKPGQRQQVAGHRLIKPGNLPDGMVPEDFENFYDRARAAFSDGQVSFQVTNADFTTVNYYFPPDPNLRSDMMKQLDTVRINARRFAWESATPGTPEEADRRADFDDATRDYADNAFRMLIVVQEGANQANKPNTNPAADLAAAAVKVQEAVDAHVTEAQRRYDEGDYTGAVAEIQVASDLVTAASSFLDAMADQTRKAVQQIEAMPGDTQALSEQPAEVEKAITDAINWAESSGINKRMIEAEDINLLMYGEKGFLQADEGGPVLDGTGQVMMKPGVVRQLVHNKAVGGVDTIKAVWLDVTRARRDPEGAYTEDRGLDNHVPIQAMVGGKFVEVQAPYTVDTVAYIVSPTGVTVPVFGKIVNVNLGGQPDVIYEQPLRPGRWSSTPITYGAPESFEQRFDEQGRAIYGWTTEDGTAWTLAWNDDSDSYMVQRMKEDLRTGELIVDTSTNLADNALAAASLIDQFVRNRDGLTPDQLARSDMVEGQAGTTDQQARLRLEQDQQIAAAAERGRNTYPLQGGASRPAGLTLREQIERQGGVISSRTRFGPLPDTGLPISSPPAKKETPTTPHVVGLGGAGDIGRDLFKDVGKTPPKPAPSQPPAGPQPPQVQPPSPTPPPPPGGGSGGGSGGGTGGSGGGTSKPPKPKPPPDDDVKPWVPPGGPPKPS